MSSEPEILFSSDAVLARLMSLSPGERGQKHFHSCLFETVICVQGTVRFCADGEPAVTLLPGQQASVASPCPHYVANPGTDLARYLLVQAGGAYDFLPVA